VYRSTTWNGFLTTAVLPPLFVSENGWMGEIAVVGRQGLVGVSVLAPLKRRLPCAASLPPAWWR
jgi:hypothetical protein